jgi:hypothetical protein
MQEDEAFDGIIKNSLIDAQQDATPKGKNSNKGVPEQGFHGRGVSTTAS